MATKKELQLRLPLYEEEANDLIANLNTNLQLIEQRLAAIEAAININQE